MSTRATTSVRRTAACLTLVGAGFAFAGGSTAWATTTTVTPATCGTPAHPALYQTVHHDAVPALTHEATVIDQAYVPGVPAIDEVSHVESTTVDGDGTPEGEGWTATGTTWTIEDSAAWTEYKWRRKVIDQAAVPGSPAVPAVTHEETVVVTPSWHEKVIDSPAVPEVAEVTEMVTVVDQPAWDETVVDKRGYAYVQKTTDKVTFRWSPSWNGEDSNGNDYGWSRAPGHDKTTVIHHPAETHQERVVVTPYSPAAPEVSHLVHHEAVTRTETVVDIAAIAAVPAIEEVSHRETGWTRDQGTAPEGHGWALTGKQVDHPATTHTRYEWTRTVVDTPAVAAIPEVPEASHTETVVDAEAVPARTERVLASEALPAGQPCAALPTAVSGMVPPATTPTAVTPTAVAAETLAQTGLDLALPLGAGLAMVFVGGALVAVRRVGSS